MSAPASLDPALCARPDPRRAAGLRRLAWALVLAGAALTALALAGDGARARAAHAWLAAFAFCWTVVLGSLFFVALQHVTRSVWSVGLRRVAEMLAQPTGTLALLLAPLLALAFVPGGVDLFPWADAQRVRQDAVLTAKAPYLDVPFFLGRAALFLLVWALFARAFVGTSLGQDRGEGGPAATARLRRLSAPFLVVFGLTVTFASFDWLMSLEPHWYSTIFGVYVFAGMTVAALAAITLGVLWARARGWLGADLVRADHLYSLGALLFAFSCFWAYVAFSQYMLIWYANLPEETFYLSHRLEHGWGAVTALLALLRFVAPFFLLLAREAKSDARRLALVSVLVLAGQAVDLYWLVMPSVHPGGPVLGWPELGPPLLLLGLLALQLARFVGRHPLVPVGDPLLDRSRSFRL